jgi:hypothetical protein
MYADPVLVVSVRLCKVGHRERNSIQIRHQGAGAKAWDEIELGDVFCLGRTRDDDRVIF